MLGFSFQYILGWITYYYVVARTRSKLSKLHPIIGVIVVFLSSLSIMTGLMEKTTFIQACSSKLSHECLIANFTGLFAVLTYISLAIALSAPRFYSLNRGNDNMLNTTDNIEQEEVTGVDRQTLHDTLLFSSEEEERTTTIIRERLLSEES